MNNNNIKTDNKADFITMGTLKFNALEIKVNDLENKIVELTNIIKNK